MAVVSLRERSGATAALNTRKLSAALWIVQGLLTLVFLFTGIMKLTASSEMLAALPLPEVFVRFLGLAETLGAIGLILPGLLRIRTGLTPAGGFRADDHHDGRDRAHAYPARHGPDHGATQRHPWRSRRHDCLQPLASDATREALAKKERACPGS